MAARAVAVLLVLLSVETFEHLARLLVTLLLPHLRTALLSHDHLLVRRLRPDRVYRVHQRHEQRLRPLRVVRVLLGR